jgi:predicted component of viral defense system (DUF524 family)
LELRPREHIADTERLHQRIRDVAQSVLNDEDYPFSGDETGQTSPRRVSPSRGAERFDSPERAFSRYVIKILFDKLKRTRAFSRCIFRKTKKTRKFHHVGLFIRTFIILVINEKMYFED